MRPRGRRQVAAIAAGLGALTLTLGASDARAALSCGKVVMKDVKLKADLIDCPGDGLVAGAPDITIDLNGHRVDGQGLDNTAGIDISNRTNVVVTGGKGGRVTGFDDGVQAASADDGRVKRLKIKNSTGIGVSLNGSDRARVTRNTIIETDVYGIELTHMDDAEITNNEITGPSTTGFTAAGLVVNASDSADNLIEGNTVVGGAQGDAGLWINGNAQHTKVKANVFKGNSQTGVFVYDGSDDTVVKRNEAVNNGYGIDVDAAAGTGTEVIGNEARKNNFDGIVLDNASISAGDNLALDNGDWGIIAVPGVTDLGGNKAAGNGMADQCSGVACGAP